MVRWSIKLVFAIAVLFTVYASIRMVHIAQPREAFDASLKETLVSAGKASIVHGDVPVAAALLFGDHLIGSGQNTVLADDNAGGHAEINAVSNAISVLGMDGFNALDRDSLTMITTFEPCAMCRGMLIEYRIKNVIYNKRKTLWHWMRDDLRWLRYEIMKQPGGPEDLQDSLFNLHPAYDPNGTGS